MKHYGDVKKIKGDDVEPVELITFGAPCQDISIAGKRKGMKHEARGDEETTRSGLFFEAIRIIKEMRENDRANGRADNLLRPRYALYENVLGAFSSNKGEDFRTVLEETARVADETAAIPRPPKGKWTNAGIVMGDGWSIAWRVFDAQFWGVPQRRKRIALVADFGGTAAPEILFERESVSRNTPQSRTTRKTTPPAVKSGIGTAITNRGAVYGDKTETLRAESHGALPITYCIQGNCIDRADTAGCNGRGFKYREGAKAGGIGFQPEKSPTITAEQNDVAVFLALENHPQDSRVKIAEDNVVQPLNGQMGTGGNNTPTVFAIDRAAYNQGINAKFNIGIDENDLAYTVVAKGPGAVCIGNGQKDQLKMSEVCSTLDCMHDQKAVMQLPIGFVRRLTPLECERLQGYPDGWTDIGEWTDSNGKIHKCTDSVRYKALGNSISLPNWFYVLQKLTIACGADVTMASLFDGIGGFPLIWESLNGKGSCLWASEIEEFPIAVTKQRFPDE